MSSEVGYWRGKENGGRLEGTSIGSVGKTIAKMFDMLKTLCRTTSLPKAKERKIGEVLLIK